MYPTQRLRQHNGEIVGGEQATSSPHHRPWQTVAFVTGFADWREALACKCVYVAILHGFIHLYVLL
jgi:hypothetical protein